MQQRLQRQVLQYQQIKKEDREAKAKVLSFRSTNQKKPAREEAAPFPVVGKPPEKDALGAAILIEQRRLEMEAQVTGAISSSAHLRQPSPMGSRAPERLLRFLPVRQAPGGWPPSECDPSQPLPRPHRPSAELVKIFASNITMWGPKAEEFLATTSAPIRVVTETHLVGHRFHDLKARMLRKGWDLYPAHATPNAKSTPGAAALELGADPGKATTGGALVAARRWLGTTAMCPITKDGVGPWVRRACGQQFSLHVVANCWPDSFHRGYLLRARPWSSG